MLNTTKSTTTATVRSPRSVSTVDLLVRHWRNASPAERIAFGRAVGVTELWDDAIEPNLT
jgi:hypothetical protein